jgi:uncharacterized membrane protein YjgN (DUF898 family)
VFHDVSQGIDLMNQMTSVPLHPAPPPPLPLAFAGDRGEFRRLVSWGAALELVTVGFYRFWLATDIRRHLWSNTVIDGDAAEYTGRARELLIGFLIAMAIIVPVYLAYFIAGLEAERLKAFASIPLVLFFYVFGQFAIYRARRYRLTRTVWRGVRFWMTGSGWKYAVMSLLWGISVSLTLGLLLPWREAALERYKMRNTFYGDLQGSFDGSGWEFFKRGWWLWLLAPFALYAFPAAPFVYAAYKAVEWRWWLSGIRIGDVRLESTMRKSALIGLYWKVVGWFVLFMVGIGAYIVGCMALVASMHGVSLEAFVKSPALIHSVPLLVLIGIGYLTTVLGLNVVMRVYLLRDIWARVIATTTVHNIEAAANVTARGELANAIGEGFADGLDVAGF